MTGRVNVGIPQQAAPLPLGEDDGSTTISLRVTNELLAALNKKARSMSLTRSSLVIIGINVVVSPDFSPLGR